MRRPRARRDELLERFDLLEAADRRVATYSGGMRRRLDLAMSLVAQPAVLFLDEPTTGLDPRSRIAVWEAVTALADDGATVLLTTQYLEEADRLADRIAVLDQGRIAAQGTAAELKARVGGETRRAVLRRRRQRCRSGHGARRPRRRRAAQPAASVDGARGRQRRSTAGRARHRAERSSCTSPPSTRSSWR